MTAAAKLLVSNGSKRSLSVSFQGETFAVPSGKTKPTPTPVAEKRGNVLAAGKEDENSRPSDQRQQQRWPGRSHEGGKNFTRSLECNIPEKKKMDGGSGGHVARALQLHSVDESFTSSASGSTLASDLATSDSESVSSRRPRAMVVPARVWQETANRLRRLPEQQSTKKSFCDGNPVSSPPGMSGGKGSSAPTHGSVQPSSPSKAPSALSPSRRKLSPSRVRSGIGNVMNDSICSTPSILSFAADARRGKIGENKIANIHELRMLHNRHLQWRFANARAATAMQVQKDVAEKHLYNASANTLRLRHSVKSKRVELQQLRQQLKLYSILKGQMPYLDDSELLDGDYSSSLAGAIESLVSSTLRLPLVGGAKANIQEVEDTISSAVDVMHGIGSSLCSLLEKVVQTNSLASELASISSSERTSLDQCRDLLSILTAMQVEDCSLRSQMLQLVHINPCRITKADCL